MDAPRTIYVFGNGNLAFAAFLELYAPPIEAVLAAPAASDWVLGDFRGVDTLTMEYLKARTDRVIVHHVGARPRYFPDVFRTPAERWTRRGGFAGDAERDAAAIAACTHFLAFDFNSDDARISGTRKSIDRCLALGRVDLGAASVPL